MCFIEECYNIFIFKKEVFVEMFYEVNSYVKIYMISYSVCVLWCSSIIILGRKIIFNDVCEVFIDYIDFIYCKSFELLFFVMVIGDLKR